MVVTGFNCKKGKTTDDNPLYSYNLAQSINAIENIITVLYIPLKLGNAHMHCGSVRYLLPVEGVFAWTYPQLIFLLELL